MAAASSPSTSTMGKADPIRRILVVEDDDALRDAIATFLTDSGYRNQQASNGQAALDLLKLDAEPCLVLVDLMMPIMNGWQLYDEMQADERFSRYPVIFLSAFPATFAPGPNFLGKPIDLHRLLSAIEEHCH